MVFIIFVLVAVFLPTLLGYGGQHSHVLDLFAHFRLLYFLAAIGLLIYSLRQHRYIALLLCLGSIGTNGYEIASAYAGSQSDTNGKPVLKLLQANIWSQNNDLQRLLSLIESEQPHIITLQEVTPHWASQLQTLAPAYPFQKIVPRNDNFGMALLSRLPLSDIDVKYHSYVPSIHARVFWDETFVDIVNVHLLPPLVREEYRIRNRDLEDIMAWAAQRPHVIITGDFNITRFSPVFQQALNKHVLQNATDGFGLLPTWPAAFGIPVIGIDHLITAPTWQVLDVKTAALIGSDHLPLIAELQLRSGHNSPRSQ